MNMKEFKIKADASGLLKKRTIHAHVMNYMAEKPFAQVIFLEQQFAPDGETEVKRITKNIKLEDGTKTVMVKKKGKLKEGEPKEDPQQIATTAFSDWMKDKDFDEMNELVKELPYDCAENTIITEL